MGDDPAGVGIGARRQWVVGQPGTRVGVDPEDRAAERHRIATRPEVLRPQRTALGGRRSHCTADAAGRVAARVDRTAGLPVVDEVEAGPFTAAHVQRPVRAERQAPDRMARVLRTPVVDQNLLADERWEAADVRQLRQPAAHHASVAGRICAGVVEPGRRSPDRGVVRVEHVDRVVHREVWVERQAEQPPVPVVVDLRTQVRHDVGGAVLEAREHLDEAALLGHEDPAVGRERQRGRLREAREDDVLLEARGQRDGCRWLGGRQRSGQQDQHCDRHDE